MQCRGSDIEIRCILLGEFGHVQMVDSADKTAGTKHAMFGIDQEGHSLLTKLAECSCGARGKSQGNSD